MTSRPVYWINAYRANVPVRAPSVVRDVVDVIAGASLFFLAYCIAVLVFA